MLMSLSWSFCLKDMLTIPLLSSINMHKYHISIRKSESIRCYLCHVASQTTGVRTAHIIQTNYHAGPHVDRPSVITMDTRNVGQEKG